MIKVKLDSLESAETYLMRLKHNLPYTWESIQYHRQVDKHWCFYNSKPKDNGNKLYKVNNTNPVIS